MPPGGFPGPSQQRVGEPPGPTGTSLGHTWALQVQIWGQLGVNWFFPHRETLFFGGQLGQLGPILNQLGAHLVHLGINFAQVSQHEPTWSELEPTWRPKQALRETKKCKLQTDL